MLMSWVRWRTRRSRVRCSASAACCSTDLIGTKRMVGRVTASQIASASPASVLPHEIDKAPFAGGRPSGYVARNLAKWVQPKLVAEVEFRARARGLLAARREACGPDTKLPAGLSQPKSWPCADEDE